MESDRSQKPRRRLGQAARQSPIVTTGRDEPKSVGVTGIGSALSQGLPRQPRSLGQDTLVAGGRWDLAGQHRHRRRRRLLEIALLTLGLLSLPLAVIWVIDDRPGIGPVLVTFTQDHGLHAFDVVL